MTTPVMFACNDPDNGRFINKFDAVHVREIEAEGPFTVLRDLGNGRVRIGRRVFRFRQWSEWVGNWCWDEILIEGELSELLEYLRDARGFDIVAGPTPVFDAWRFGQPLQKSLDVTE